MNRIFRRVSQEGLSKYNSINTKEELDQWIKEFGQNPSKYETQLLYKDKQIENITQEQLKKRKAEIDLDNEEIFKQTQKRIQQQYDEQRAADAVRAQQEEQLEFEAQKAKIEKRYPSKDYDKFYDEKKKEWKIEKKQSTLGLIADILNPFTIRIDSRGIQWKDPITSLYDKFKTISQFKKNKFKDVWIGRRPLLGAVGVRNIVLDALNVDVMHYATKVDGRIYNLTGDIANATPIVMEFLNVTDKANETFNWEYIGKRKREMDEIEKLVHEINNRKLKYSLMNKNCQFISKAIAEYAVNPQYTLEQAFKDMQR